MLKHRNIVESINDSGKLTNTACSNGKSTKLLKSTTIEYQTNLHKQKNPRNSNKKHNHNTRNPNANNKTKLQHLATFFSATEAD